MARERPAAEERAAATRESKPMRTESDIRADGEDGLSVKRKPSLCSAADSSSDEEEKLGALIYRASRIARQHSAAAERADAVPTRRGAAVECPTIRSREQKTDFAMAAVAEERHRLALERPSLWNAPAVAPEGEKAAAEADEAKLEEKQRMQKKELDRLRRQERRDSIDPESIERSRGHSDTVEGGLTTALELCLVEREGAEKRGWSRPADRKQASATEEKKEKIRANEWQRRRMKWEAMTEKKRANDRKQLRMKREAMTEEEKEKKRATERKRYRMKWKAMTEEEKEKKRASERKRQKMERDARRRCEFKMETPQRLKRTEEALAAVTEEQKKVAEEARKRWESMTKEERKKHRDYHASEERRQRREKQKAMAEEEREKQRAKGDAMQRKIGRESITEEENEKYYRAKNAARKNGEREERVPWGRLPLQDLGGEARWKQPGGNDKDGHGAKGAMVNGAVVRAKENVHPGNMMYPALVGADKKNNVTNNQQPHQQQYYVGNPCGNLHYPPFHTRYHVPYAHQHLQYYAHARPPWHVRPPLGFSWQALAPAVVPLPDNTAAQPAAIRCGSVRPAQPGSPRTTAATHELSCGVARNHACHQDR